MSTLAQIAAARRQAAAMARVNLPMQATRPVPCYAGQKWIEKVLGQ